MRRTVEPRGRYPVVLLVGLVAMCAMMLVSVWSNAAIAAETSVDQLISGLYSQDVSAQMGSAARLRAVGADAVPALIEAIHNPGYEDGNLRWIAARTLGEIGTDEVVPVLVNLLGDANSLVRLAAIHALEGIGIRALDVSPQYLDALSRVLVRDNDPVIKAAAADALRKLGLRASGAVPSLLVSLGGSDTKVAWAVTRALNVISPGLNQTATLTSLVEGDDTELYLRLAAIDALVRLSGSKERETVIERIEGMDDVTKWMDPKCVDASAVWDRSNGIVIVNGWDWSLPPEVKPAEFSGFVTHAKPGPDMGVSGNRLQNLVVRWRDVEPTEGVYDFSSIVDQIQAKPDYVKGFKLDFRTTVVDAVENLRSSIAVPGWLVQKYGIPLIPGETNDMGVFLSNAPVWNEDFHRHYLKLIEAFGRSGIPQMDEIVVAHVNGISKSNGEEFYMPPSTAAWCEANAGLTPEVLERCFKERLDAWSEAFKGVEHKLMWVGNGVDGVDLSQYKAAGRNIMTHAYDLGMGQRNGFVEVYMTHVENEFMGQSVDAEGYLVVDESCPPIAENRAFGDENEEYSPRWVTRFGPIEGFAHRYRESMLRTLQMRRNFLLIDDAGTEYGRDLTSYVGLELGKTISDAPDAWVYLRESYMRSGVGVRPVKNFERWVYQRDREGYRTVPVNRVDQHPMMYPTPLGYRYDYTARRTDMATGNDRIGLAIDDRFLTGGPHKVAVKVTYQDAGHGSWDLVYQSSEGERSKTIQCADTGEVKTATFFLDGAFFNAAGMDYDLEIHAAGEDAVILFVRVVK